MAQVWVDNGDGTGYYADDGSVDFSGYGNVGSTDLTDTTTTAGQSYPLIGGGTTQDINDPSIDWNGYGSATSAELAGTTTAGTPSSSVDLSGIAGALKSLVQTGGAYDYTKIAPLLAGLYGASQSNTRTQPAGYQGKIPTYTATRQAPSAGQTLSGNVLYRKPDGTVVNPNSAAPATAVAPTSMAKGGLLESGGFVIPADVVSHLGNGSSEAGLRLLQKKLGATPIKGHGDGMSDSIKTTIDGHQPARVANEEARLTKAQVDAAGGAKKLYAMMDRIREARTGSKQQGKQINPSKFMPGGSVQSYADGGTTVPAGTTGTESNLSNWAGDYVTNMLGKGQALSEMPYEQYGGPLTAGPSGLQTQAFNTAANLSTPTSIGTAATTAGGIANAAQNLNYAPVGTDFGTTQAQQYMNPYLKASLDPQLAELQRQNQIANMGNAAQLTKAGAYGGSRQAVMNAENQRNMLEKTNQLVSQGYNTAYDKAMAQFNADQARKAQEAQFGSTLGLQGLQAANQAAQTQGQLGLQQNQANLANLQEQANLGATQQGLASADIAAQKAAFEEARLNPFKMVQFQQSLLSGLPLAAQTYNQAPTNNLTQFADAATTLNKMLAALGQTPATTTPAQ